MIIKNIMDGVIKMAEEKMTEEERAVLVDYIMSTGK